VVIVRLPRMMESQWHRDCCELMDQPIPADTPLSLAHPRSTCPQCGAGIRAWHNIPLLSWLVLRGRCADCSAAISIRYPLIELVTGILFAAAAWQFGYSAETLSALVLIAFLIGLTGIDLDTQLLPDALTLPLLWLGLGVNLFQVWTTLPAAVVGAMLGYGALWSVYWAFKLITGKEGMGYGDFKLLAALGAWMGWHMLPMIILLSTATGAIVGIAGIVFIGRNKDMPMAFGPFLAAAGWLAFVWGDKILSGYLSLFNF